MLIQANMSKGRFKTFKKVALPLLCAQFLLAVFTNKLHAQPQTENDRVFDLVTVYQLAQSSDPAFLAAKAQLQAELENQNQAFAAFLPSLNLNAHTQKENNKREIIGLTYESSGHPKSYSVNLNQALFKPQAWETYKQSQLSEEIARLTWQKAQQDLILRITQAYFNVLVEYDNLNTLLAQKTAIQKQLESAQINFEIGTATVTDQQEAQARFDLIAAQELSVRNNLEVAKLALENMTGEPVQWLRPLQTTANIVMPEPSDLQAWADKALASNKEVEQSRLAQLISKQEVQKARYAHFPTLDLNAQFLDSNQQIFDTASGRPFNLGLESKSIGLTLNLPLYAGGATQSKVRQQLEQLSKAEFDLDRASRNATQLAKSSFLGIKAGLLQIVALDTAVNSSTLALKANQTGYEVGIRINIDVLNAQQQLSATQRDLSKARYDTLQKMLQLQASVGQLAAQDLIKLNELFSRTETATVVDPSTGL